MGRTEIAGFRPKSYKNLQAKARKTANFSNKIRDFRIVQAELLIIGANSVIIKRHVHAAAQPGTWLGEMLKRKPPMLVRVALANMMARIVWALMAKGGIYRSSAAAA